MATRTSAAGSGRNADNPLRDLKDVVKERKALDKREAALVKKARKAGYVWEDIAAAMGVSKQAVHKRFGAAPSSTPRKSR
jgi:DNA invertase Pin-like site-specific DNA recombinase